MAGCNISCDVIVCTVRQVARELGELSSVVIVDTSNEIAGDGDTPHKCVGNARRMMVGSLNEQAHVMIECVQNHTPDVMVVDEIGRPKEVHAAHTCQLRGVRLVASAHGDLRGLLKNSDLNGLLGGIAPVTLGDAQAKEYSERTGRPFNKLVTQRMRAPTFEVVIELPRGGMKQWRVVANVAQAVDDILEGRKYTAELRSASDREGEPFSVELVKM